MSRFDAPIAKHYTYVDSASPSNPEEGETWYDTDAPSGEPDAKVWDGNAWVGMNISQHGSLSGITSGDHHSRYTDSEAAAAAPVQSVEGSTGDVSLSVSEAQATPEIPSSVGMNFSEPGSDSGTMTQNRVTDGQVTFEFTKNYTTQTNVTLEVRDRNGNVVNSAYGEYTTTGTTLTLSLTLSEPVFQAEFWVECVTNDGSVQQTIDGAQVVYSEFPAYHGHTHSI